MSEYQYKYETHLHTSEVSACSVCSGAEHVRNYKKLGYTGIMVTDHFFYGNTHISMSLPWVEMVEQFCLGFERAKTEGDRIGLDVYFGWESNFQAIEFLIYGLDKEWLIKHPQILNWNIEEQYKYVTADGGLVVHAHPFRETPYIKTVCLFPEYVDAVEVANISNDFRNLKFNKKALQYAKENNLPMTGGSDIHDSSRLGGGMAFKKPLKGIDDFIKKVKSGKEYQVLT